MAGELSRISALGEGARLMLRGLEWLHVATWAVDAGGPMPAAARFARAVRAADRPGAAPPAGGTLGPDPPG